MAKRVNTRFLIILTSALACLLSAAVIAKFTLIRPNSGASEAAGDQFVKEGDYKQALDRYRFALGGVKNPAPLLIKVGDAFHHMVAEDPENLINARNTWSQALAHDPKFEPALQRLLDSYWEEAMLAERADSPARPDTYAAIRDTAERLSELRPADTKVKARQLIATAKPWLFNLPSKKDDAEKAVRELISLMKRDPADGDIRACISTYKLKNMWEARKHGDYPAANDLAAQVAALFDAPLADPPKDPQANAVMQLRAAKAYRELDSAERITAAQKAREAGQPPVTGTAPAGPSAAKAAKALAAAMDAARTLPADNPLVYEVYREAIESTGNQRKVAEAEKLCEELTAKRPDDQNARLLYAAVLTANPSPARRDKAIEVLSREVKVTGLVGPEGRMAQGLRLSTLAELIRVKIEVARAIGQPQPGDAAVAKPEELRRRQDQMIADIQADMKRLESMASGEMFQVLRLKAQLLQLEGKPAEALGMFRRAVALMEGEERKDWELINELAHAYLNAGQTGSAKQYLQRIVNQYESHVPTRLLLANVLLTENKVEEARAQLGEAEKHLANLTPGSPEHVRARAEFDRIGLALMRMTNDPRLEQQYAALPETTRAERLGKASMARQIKKPEEAIRLTRLAVKDDPKDMDAFRALLGALLGADRRADALAAAEAFLAANPDKAAVVQPYRDRLKAAVELADATPKQVYERRKQLIEAEPESVARSLKLADLERDYQNFDAAEQILQKVHNEKPGEIIVVDQLFELNLVQRKWEKAKGYLDKLVAAKADEADGLLYQFRFAMSKQDSAEALRLGKQLTMSRPDFDVSFVAYGQALQKVNRTAEAIKQYQAARQRKPRNVEALRGLVECYTQQLKPEDIRNTLNEARLLFPNDPRFREMDLEYQLNFGDPLVVVTEREQMQRERPEAAQTSLDLATAYRTAARVKGDADPARKAELLGKARDLLQKGMARWEGDGRFVVQAADVALDGGDFATGEKLLQAYADRPDRKDRFEPQMLLAEYYARASKPDAAQKAYESALGKALALVKAAPADRKDVAAAMTAAANDIRLNLSGFLAGLGRFDDALKVLDNAADAADVRAGAAADRRIFNQRLNVLIMAGRRDLAEEALVDALANNKVAGAAGDVGLQMTLVRVNYEGGKYDAALERVNNILKADPENLEALFYRGQINLRKPQPDVAKAIADLLEVRKGDDRNAATRILLADAYRTTGDTPKAIRELEEGLRVDPLSREMRLRLMDFRSSPGSEDYNEVLRLAGEAKLQPQLKSDAVWSYRESKVYEQRKDWNRAIPAIEEALRLAPNDMSLVREYQSILVSAGNYKQVLDQTDRVVKENKAPWWVFMNRAAAKHGLKDEAGAMSEYNLALTAAGADNAAAELIVKSMTTTVGKDKAVQEVMARAGQDVRWKLLAAALHSVYKDWDQAVKCLDDVQQHFEELNPRQKAQALRISGPLYQLARPPQLDKAKDAYLKLLKMAPDDLFALNNLATLLVDDSLVSQPREARQYSERAYEQVKRAQPFPAAILDTHGWVLIQCGGKDVDDGIEILQRVIRQTSLPEAHYHLAEGYLKKQAPKKALSELKVAAESISRVSNQGIQVSPDLEQKIQSATDRANEMLRGQATAQ
jgi:tetratricopeptide (TPR) repeat protein